MALVNRCAVTVTPLAPMLAWLRPFSNDADGLRRDGGLDPGGLYLIDVCDDEAQASRLLEEASVRIFEQELELWCRDRERWPPDRTPALFRSWFAVQIHDLVDDLGQAPLTRLELDPGLPDLLRQAMGTRPPASDSL